MEQTHQQMMQVRRRGRGVHGVCGGVSRWLWCHSGKGLRLGTALWLEQRPPVPSARHREEEQEAAWREKGRQVRVEAAPRTLLARAEWRLDPGRDRRSEVTCAGAES